MGRAGARPEERRRRDFRVKLTFGVDFSAQELKRFIEAMRPWRQCKEKEQEWVGEVVRLLEAGLRSLSEAQVDRLRDAAQALQEALHPQAMARAMPSWIEAARVQEEQGQVPFVQHPEQAVEILREIRCVQLAALKDMSVELDKAKKKLIAFRMLDQTYAKSGEES